MADEPAGSYGVTAVGSPDGDSAYAVFTVRPGTPSITLDSQTGAPGTAVQVSGTSFSANDTSCTLSDSGAGENESCSIAVGTVTASFVVANAAAGSYTITVTGTPDGDWASQTFTVISSPPSLSLNETSAPVGTGVQVSGSGFPSSDANCTLSGEVVTSANCSLSSGELSGSFVVANVATGLYTITAASSPSGDSVSANFTVTGPLMNETMGNSTTLGGPDFSITSSPSVTLAAGGSGAAMVSVLSLNGFSSPVILSASWVGTPPAGVNLTLPSPITPTPSGSASDALTITASSNASAGTFELQVTGTSGPLTHAGGSNITVQILHAQSVSTVTSTGSINASSTTAFPARPTCAVSSATSGSELAPLVETLRGFRDQSILKTRTGEAFMALFNPWYYSFSPPVASYVSTHQTQRTMFRYALYPLIGILYASYYSYSLVSPLNNEIASLTAGLVAAGMLGFIYIAIPVHLARRVLRRRVGVSMPGLSRLAGCFVASGVLVGTSYRFGGEFALSMATVSLILSTLSLGAAVGNRALSYVDFAYMIPKIAALSRHLKSLAWRRTIRVQVRGQEA